MKHLKRHDYEKDILKILDEKGGGVESFNVLLDEGKFHPKILRKYLNKLKFEHRISIDRVKNRDRICLESFDFNEDYTKFTADMKRLKTKFFRKNLDYNTKMSLTKDYLFLGLKKLHALNLAKLNHECVTQNEHQIEIIERTKNKLFWEMRQRLKKLDENDQIRVLDYMAYTKMMF